MKITKESKPYWNSSNKDALAVIIPKIIRENLELDENSKIQWEMDIKNDGEINITFNKIE